MFSFRRKRAPTGDAGSAGSSTPAAASADSTQPVVLIADDNETVREGVGQLLRQRGFEPRAVADGKAVVSLLKTETVDALILDLHMPGGDGFDVLTYTQQHRQSLPVILVTGLSPDEIQAKMSRKGTTSLPPMFQKPCDYEQLIGVLQMMIQGELQTS